VTTRKKVLVTLACVAGAAVSLAPFVVRYAHVGSSSRANDAFARYVQRTRHRGVRDVKCSSDHSGVRDQYLCFFRYAGHNPFVVPKSICIRLVANEARQVNCFVAD
jgi:hypothetical protein